MAQIYHPQLGQNLNYELTPVADGGDGQTGDVIQLMGRYAAQDSISPEIQADALAAIKGYAARGGSGNGSESPDPISAVFHHVKSQVRFTQDHTTAAPIQQRLGDPVVEVLIRPRDMVRLCDGAGGGCVRQGDCDDFSMYTASLLLALDVPCKFATVAADLRSNDYSHVYVVAYDPYTGARVPLDTSHGPYPGWETPSAFRRQEWDLPSPALAGVGWMTIITAAGLVAVGAYLCR